MKFRSHHDKDCIGKRRRVANSTSHKGQPATRRLITPLFEDRIVHPEHMMSGALQTQEVQVRIGTDALASQTQQSRRSHTSQNRSARHGSTDLGSLSEEPMLLGDEVDMFETMLPRSHATPVPELDRHEIDLRSERSDNQQSDSFDFGGMVDTHDTQREAFVGTEIARMIDIRTMPIESGLLPDPNPHTHPAHPNGLASSFHESTGLSASATDRPHDPIAASSNARRRSPSAAAAEVDDEAFWRRLLNFDNQDPRNTSTDAVKSSSLHITSSESDHRPVLPGFEKQFVEVDAFPSIHSHASQEPEAQSMDNPRKIGASNETLGLPLPFLLEQTQKLGNRSKDIAKAPQQEAREDAAWRDFIIGSQISSPASLRGVREQQPDEEEPDIDMSLFDLSGLGSSVKSTVGGTQHMVGPTPRQPWMDSRA